MNMTVKMTGMNIMTFCWVGSPAAGVRRCWRNMDAPMSKRRKDILCKV